MSEIMSEHSHKEKPVGQSSASIPLLRWLANTKVPLAPVLLFLLALAPRLPGLRRFLTTDEPYFAQQAADVVTALLDGRFADTYWHFYPGVTISWLDGLGFLGQWLRGLLVGAPFSLDVVETQHGILEVLVALRLPYAILSAAFVVAVFYLARRLFDSRVAALAALLLALDPFWLAHSRVAHGDGPVTVFLGLSVLLLFAALPPWTVHRPIRHRLLSLSAVAGGLAALTKAPGQFIALFVPLVALEDWVTTSWREGAPDLVLARRWLLRLGAWAGIATLVFVALWPAMWVDAVGTINRMLTETFGKVEAGHLVFFMGEPTLDPGPWFYPYTTLIRMTPVVTIGVLLSLVVLGIRFVQLRRWRVPTLFDRDVDKAALFLWAFVLSLLLFGNLSPKKQDRYLLALFPFLDLLAAYAWIEVIGFVVRLAGRIPRAEFVRSGNDAASPFRPPMWLSSRLPLVLSYVLIALHAYPVVTAYPYYLAYFNPLLGGLPRAVQTTLVGWGEGMEQVAAHLNTLPNAEEMTVASVPSQTMLPYFEGTGENFYTNDVALRSDKVVFYISQLQRRAPSPEIVRAFSALEPEHVITVLGQPYAWIYDGPRVITADLPAEAEPVNIGFGDMVRLAGYAVSDGDGEMAITLYWHAMAPMERPYSVSVRLLDAGGSWLAQQDGWPVNGLLPTTQFRVGDYVADEHRLEVEAPDAVTTVQVVLYDADTGAAVGAPADLAMGW
jgi:hypothetical protein